MEFTITFAILMVSGMIWLTWHRLFNGPLPSESIDAVTEGLDCLDCLDGVPKEVLDPIQLSAKADLYKSNDAVTVDEAPKAKPVPTKTDLNKLTKSKIEAKGQEFGINLDVNVTKAQMIEDFLTAVKEQAKIRF